MDESPRDQRMSMMANSSRDSLDWGKRTSYRCFRHYYVCMFSVKWNCDEWRAGYSATDPASHVTGRRAAMYTLNRHGLGSGFAIPRMQRGPAWQTMGIWNC